MSADDTPPRVIFAGAWWSPTVGVIEIDPATDHGFRFRSAFTDEWNALGALPADAVELRPAPAPVEDDELAELREQVGSLRQDRREAYVRHGEDWRKQDALSRLLRGMARRASRYRRKLHLAAQDAARHHAAAPETSDPTGAEVASRLSAAAEVCEQHRHHGLAYEFSQIASHLDEDGYSAEVCAAVARALSGPVTTTEAQEG